MCSKAYLHSHLQLCRLKGPTRSITVPCHRYEASLYGAKVLFYLPAMSGMASHSFASVLGVPPTISYEDMTLSQATALKSTIWTSSGA